MSQIFTSIYTLLQQLFTGAPSYVTGEICQWVAVALCFLLVSIPFVLVFKIIRLLMGVCSK